MNFNKYLMKISRKWIVAICLILLCTCLTAGVYYQSQVKNITFIVGGSESKISTMKSTVAELLQERKIVLRETDRIVPGTQEKLSDDMQITLYYSVPYTLTVDGNTSSGESTAVTVHDLLQELAVECGEFDRVLPDPSTELTKNTEIRVTRVSQEIVSESVVLPYTTSSIPSNDLFAGQQRVTLAGINGLTISTYLVISEDGIVVSKQLQNTEEKQAMSNQILEYGTQSQTQLANRDEISFYQTATMTTTGYCSCYLCCGKNPGDYGYGITASGLPQGYGVVGVDTSMIPYGTKLYVEGYGYAVAGDTGGAIVANHLDLGFNSHSDAVAWAKRNVTVYFLTD